MASYFTLFSVIFLLLSTCCTDRLNGNVYPIQFSISESKIVTEIPAKDQDFAFIYPGRYDTYIFDEEADYYHDYQRSYFALTKKKGGWDCLRHYEILANGCIPYFIDLDKCNPMTMTMLPKDLILEAMNLPGVKFLEIDHSQFDKVRYYEILTQLLEHTRKHLTGPRMAEYLLKTVNYSGTGNILFLSKELNPDYLRCCTLIGLKQLLGQRLVDIPKLEYIYKSFDKDIHQLHAKGMTYSKVVDDLPVDRENIEERIEHKEFDLIIYGSVHRGLPFYELVTNTYDQEKIIYLCGDDAHECKFVILPQLFLREFDGYVHKPLFP